VHKPSSVLGKFALGQQPAPGLEKVFFYPRDPCRVGWSQVQAIITARVSHQSSHSPEVSAGLAQGVLLPGQPRWTGSGLCVIDLIQTMGKLRHEEGQRLADRDSTGSPGVLPPSSNTSPGESRQAAMRYRKLRAI